MDISESAMKLVNTPESWRALSVDGQMKNKSPAIFPSLYLSSIAIFYINVVWLGQKVSSS
jgi:hypothetical protein